MSFLKNIFGGQSEKETELDRENRHLAREVNEKDTEAKLSRRDVDHLEEKLRAAQDEIREKDSKIKDLERKLELAEEKIRDVEKASGEKGFENVFVKTQVDHMTSELNDKKAKYEAKKQQLHEARSIVTKSEEEKRNLEKESAILETKYKMKEQELAKEEGKAKEQQEFFLQLKDRDDRNTELIAKTMGRVMDFAENAVSSRSLTSSGINQPEAIQQEPVHRRRKDLVLPKRIRIGFCPKESELEYFQKKPEEGDNLEDCLEYVLEDHEPLRRAFKITRNESVFDAIRAAKYSLLTIRHGHRKWTKITSHDDLLDLIEDQVEVPRTITLYLVHNEEKESRLDEILVQD